MQRSEALHLLGLEEGATDAEIKTAYKETAQIMHPDRFADNKKLQARATEQFKAINEAKDLLLSGKNTGARSGAEGSAREYASAHTQTGANSSTAELRAKLNGINLARANVIAQIDNIHDTRGVGFLLLGVGGVAAFIFRRSPLIMSFALPAVIYGVVRVMNDIFTLRALNNALSEYDKQKAEIERMLG